MVVPFSCTSCRRVMLSDLEPAKALMDTVTAKTNRATRAGIRVIGNLLYSFWRPTRQKTLAFPAKSHKMSLRGQTAQGTFQSLPRNCLAWAAKPLAKHSVWPRYSKARPLALAGARPSILRRYTSDAVQKFAMRNSLLRRALDAV